MYIYNILLIYMVVCVRVLATLYIGPIAQCSLFSNGSSSHAFLGRFCRWFAHMLSPADLLTLKPYWVCSFERSGSEHHSFSSIHVAVWPAPDSGWLWVTAFTKGQSMVELGSFVGRIPFVECFYSNCTQCIRGSLLYLAYNSHTDIMEKSFLAPWIHEKLSCLYWKGFQMNLSRWTHPLGHLVNKMLRPVLRLHRFTCIFEDTADELTSVLYWSHCCDMMAFAKLWGFNLHLCTFIIYFYIFQTVFIPYN